MPRILLPMALAVFCSTCGTEPPVPEEKEAPKVKLEGWKDVAGGKMNPDGSFYSEAGHFIAVFPGEPVHESTDVETEVGRVRMEVYVHEQSVTLAYMIAYSDYPSKYIADVGWKDFLDRAMMGALKSLGIENVERKEDVVINGFHGVKYRGHNDASHIVSQILLVGNRMFQITLLSDGSYPPDAACDQFIEGFHMILADHPVEEDWWPKDFPMPPDTSAQ